MGFCGDRVELCFLLGVMLRLAGVGGEAALENIGADGVDAGGGLATPLCGLESQWQSRRLLQGVSAGLRGPHRLYSNLSPTVRPCKSLQSLLD